MPRPRVVVADDHPLLLVALVSLLEADGDFEVVAAVDSGRRALRALAQLGADIVLLDLVMPQTDGLDCLRTIRERHPSVTAVVLSGVDDPQVARAALRLGAAAFVKKTVDPRDLPAILRQALEHTVVLPAAGDEELAGALGEARRLLTPAELAVLVSLASGSVNKEIAAELGIAEQTVKFHLTHVYRKLGVANRTGAIRFAFDHGLAERELVSV